MKLHLPFYKWLLKAFQAKKGTGPDRPWGARVGRLLYYPLPWLASACPEKTWEASLQKLLLLPPMISTRSVRSWKIRPRTLCPLFNSQFPQEWKGLENQIRKALSCDPPLPQLDTACPESSWGAIALKLLHPLSQLASPEQERPCGARPGKLHPLFHGWSPLEQTWPAVPSCERCVSSSMVDVTRAGHLLWC